MLCARAAGGAVAFAMDSLIAAAARALAAGDALARSSGSRCATTRRRSRCAASPWRSSASIRARASCCGARRAASARTRSMARARCVVAEAEVALAMRDLGGSPRALAAAAATLEARADHANALQARLIAARRLLLLGRLDEAAAGLAPTRRTRPAATAARGGRADRGRAGTALAAHRRGAGRARARPRGRRARRRAGPAGRSRRGARRARPTRRAALRRGPRAAAAPHEVAALLDSGALVLDACRRGLRAGDTWLPLARRPILFTLARALAEAWPGDVEREALIARAFRTRHPDETHRARLRVEIGRLRALVAPLAGIEATARGFVLAPRTEREVAVLVPPIDGDQASLLALLADGAAWSTSALALALGDSQRTVQRALVELEGEGRVRADRPGARAALAGAAAGRIHDDLVTPCCAAARVDCLHRAERRPEQEPAMSPTQRDKRQADAHRRARPRSFANTAPSPAREGRRRQPRRPARVGRRRRLAGRLRPGERRDRRAPSTAPADAGTAFDGKHL